MFGYVNANDTIRRYISLFGTLFNDIWVTRTNQDGTTGSQFRVPIMYGPRDKALARVQSDPELNRPWAAVLPIMTFELVSMYYDADRHLKKVGRNPGRRPGPGSKDVVANVYNPVPYTFNFKLQVTVKNVQDGTSIITDILPWFSPDWTTTVRIIDQPEILLDVPVILNPVEMQDTWEGDYSDTRYITYTLSFKMLGYMYGPTRRDKIIKVSRVRVGTSANNIDVEVRTTPGMTANGEPTSNSAISVPYSQIDWDDDYGFIEQRFLDGQE